MADEKQRERARARAEERRAMLNAWKERVDAHFCFLRTVYGFHTKKATAPSGWETQLVYTSDVAAVSITRTVEFDRVEVSLMRLVNGKLPEVVVFVHEDTRLNAFLLDNLLALRAPSVLEELRAAKGLSDEQVERSLTLLASAVQEYAADILRGDFTVFAALQEIVKQRVREHPQTITIWVPEGGPTGSEATLVEKVHRDDPEQPIEVRRYRRPSRRTSKGRGVGEQSE